MKIELELPDKPEVHAIAAATGIDPDAVVGKLIRVWQWFDKHTEDGNAPSVTVALVDRITNTPKFGESMQLVSWLHASEGGISMPKFDRHTSESSKKRALSAKRQSRYRNANGDADSDAKSVTTASQREDVSNINKGGVKTKTKTPLPKDFEVSERVRRWAQEKGHRMLATHLEAFKSACLAKDYRYVDWDEAFMNAIRNNWARIDPALGVKRLAQ